MSISNSVHETWDDASLPIFRFTVGSQQSKTDHGIANIETIFALAIEPKVKNWFLSRSQLLLEVTEALLDFILTSSFPIVEKERERARNPTRRMEAVGLDEFGREHFVVEAAPGRLCMTLGETEQGFVIVCRLDSLTQDDLAAWDEVDRKRMQLLRQTVSIGDRLIAIEDEDVVHCNLREVSVRLGKLAAKQRRLTFARYHTSHYDGKKYDVEKLVLVHAPRGPLGLLISELLHYGAVVDGFLPLPDGSTSKLAKDPRIHRGCQIVNVNGIDVSCSPREKVIEVLSSLRDQEKEIIVYRAAPETCDKFVQVEYASVDVPHGFSFDESENFKCVVTATTTPAVKAALLQGDVLISVNDTDVSSLNRQDTLALLSTAPFPRKLYFYRSKPADLPECHQIRIESGPFGLNLDGTRPDHAVVAGFTSAAGADRPVFKSCASFLPGSHIISINKLCVVNHSLAEISSMLLKLKQSPKDIIIANETLVNALKKRRSLEVVSVLKGPLGIHFDGARPDQARVSGFYPMPDGQRGPIESSCHVPIGSSLRSINCMNVSCLKLAQVTDLLKKLSDVPKELCFHTYDEGNDVNTKVVHVQVPSGPLCIDLKRSISNKVIVDRLNNDSSLGSTFILDHGGVVPGSEVVAIDGFDVTSLEITEVTQLLRMIASHEKTITFSTTVDAYTSMLSSSRTPGLKSVIVVHSPLGIEFDPSTPQEAVISAYNSAALSNSASGLRKENIPIGSRLVGIDQVDLRALDLKQIASVLKDFAGIQKTLVFDTTLARPKAPSSPTLATQISATGGVGGGSPASSPRSQATRFNLPNNSVNTAASATSSPPPSPQRRGFFLCVGFLRTSSYFNFTASTVAVAIAAGTTVDQTARCTEIHVVDGFFQQIEQKQLQQQEQQLSPPKTEYMINMSSWTGSRSLYRMAVDLSTSSLQITSAKVPSSPKAGGKSSGATTTVLFSEITALDYGKKGDAGSSSSSGGSGGGAQVVITMVKGKKAIELDMRSRDERQEFYALMTTLVPALRQVQQ